MPRFIDHHAWPELPPEAIQQWKDMAEAGQADPNGVVPFNVFGGSDGTAFCYSEAPTAEAVIKTHAGMGIILKPEEVTEVTVLV